MYNDKPIEKIKQDELSRETFIKNLSKAIINSFESEEPIDSLTIGLMGEWGYGKTSCLNMISENLKNEDKDIKIIEFNPWIYSSDNQLTEYFFNELIYGLEDEDNDLRMDLNKYLNRYKVKTNRIDQIKKIVRGIGKCVPIDFKEFIGKNSQEENLKIYKDNINDKLKDYKILCIIDNIDRLSKEEIIVMFKLIKNIADFKNIIYLIAFDYEIVSKLLKDIGDKNYLEKIINVPLYLPKITQNELYNILLENLKDISRKYNLEKDDERLNKLLNKIIYFFNHMRDIKRFFNIFDFNFELVKDEVDFIDFIALTVIQVFEPESYNKLFSYGPFISGSSMTKVNEKNDITNGNKHVRYVLDFLTNNSSSNLALYSEKQNNWDCYFKLNPNIKEVKEEELNLFFEYVNSKNKKEAANKKLKDMLDYNEKYLDAIKYRLERIKELELFLECLFQYGNYPLFFAFLSSNKDLIRKIKEKNKEYDFAIFFNKINNVYEFDNFLKYFQKLVEDSLLFECEYDELETIAKNKYINHFNNFNSDYYRYLSNFLYIGYKLSFDDKLKKFVNDELLSTKEGLINLLDHIVYVQSNSDSEKWRIQQISNAVSIDIICEKIKQHDITNEESVKRFREDYSRYESLWNNSYDPNFTEPPVTWSEIKFERV